MENHEIPYYAATLGIETLELLWDRRSWITPDVVMDRDVLAAAADKMLEHLQNYRPHQITKTINASSEYLSTDTLEAGLSACKELLRKPRFHGNFGTDPNVRKVIRMTLGEVRHGRDISKAFVECLVGGGK